MRISKMSSSSNNVDRVESGLLNSDIEIESSQKINSLYQSSANADSNENLNLHQPYHFDMEMPTKTLEVGSIFARKEVK